MKIEEIITELEGIEREWNGHALAEKLGGNVVKEAHYKGTATGVRIAINVINERDAPASFAAPTLLGALVQVTKDFDVEEWKEQDSSCLLCHNAMSLDDGCEWPDDPRLLLCWSCMSYVLAETLARLEAPNGGAKASGA